jgi:FG-GAP repeat
VDAVSNGGVLGSSTSLNLTHWQVLTLILGAVLACVGALALARLPSTPTPSSTHPLTVRRGLQSHPATLMPISLAPAVSASIGASDHSFWPVRRGASLLTQGWGVHSIFNASGVSFRAAHGTLGLSLAAIGRGRRFDPIATVAPIAASNQVIYRRGSITEFYRNGPYGLEQGFTLQRRPLVGAGPLVLALRLGGSLVAQQAGSQVLFKTRSGVRVLRYGRLSAVDAAGRSLLSHMEIRNGAVQLLIDDSRARYPLRIDPFIQQGEKLTGGAEEGEGYFGTSVALSSDGDTALIGGYGDHHFLGAAWVFTRSGSTWTQQGEKLTGSGEIGSGAFGARVALSADGNTALIGAPGDNEGVGAAWVFTRSGSTWAQQGEKLTGSGEVGEGDFGGSVTLSSDGSTALIGGPGDGYRSLGDGYTLGAAWVFTRSGSTWTQQGEKLVGSEKSGEGEFGSSVALSSDGNTALIGADDGAVLNSGFGAAWIFTRSGEAWMQQGKKLVGSGASEFAYFGDSVALSSDGNTALIGGWNNERSGAAWVFIRTGETWLQQGAKLTGNGETGEDFGQSVALSSEGNIALVGAQGEKRVGAAWVFTRTGSTWTQQEGLTARGETREGGFGFTVALSSDGDTALIGGWGENERVGASWVFVPSQPPTAATGEAQAQQMSATLNATVNPDGEEVGECRFEYGTSVSYGSSVPCNSLPGSGESPVEVSAPITGLAANSSYHFRIVATNLTGTGYGSDQAFTTLPYPPTVETGLAEVTQTAATLNATVNPDGEEVGECRFEYGTSVSYGSSLPCRSLPGSGESPVGVSAPVTDLSESTTYHFRIVARSAGGTSYGRDQTLKTLRNQPSVTGVAPLANAAPPSGSSPPSSSLAVARQSTVVTTSGVFTIRMYCSGSPCSGTIKLTAGVKKKIGSGKRKKTSTKSVTIDSASFSGLVVGAHSVSLKLNSIGLRLLRRDGYKLSSTVTARYASGSTTKTTKATVSLSGTKPRRSRVATSAGRSRRGRAVGLDASLSSEAGA